MVAAMDREGFGNCTNHTECEAACPNKSGFANTAQELGVLSWHKRRRTKLEVLT